MVTQHQCDQLKELLALDVTKSQAIIRSVGMTEVADRFKPELQTADKAIESLLTAMSAQSTSNIQQTTQTLIGQYKAYKKTRDEVLNLVQLGQTIEANDKEQTKLAPAAHAVAVSSDNLKTHVSENTREAQAHFMQTTLTSRTLIVLLTLVTLSGGMLWAWVIARSISRPAQIGAHV